MMALIDPGEFTQLNFSKQTISFSVSTICFLVFFYLLRQIFIAQFFNSFG